ncbi:MAG: transcriptional regulator [Candidatus Moraniibacteriota bacterium]|nr:MAG: transcriptional regulator [Candidatus Moranbacteria bacterium]
MSSQRSPKTIPTTSGTCPKQALKIFGDFETLFIVEVLGQGELRFCALQRALGDMNPVTLTRRLKRLEQEGIIGRRTEADNKLSVSYYLERKGKHMLPVIRGMRQFAEKYL